MQSRTLAGIALSFAALLGIGGNASAFPYANSTTRNGAARSGS